MELIHEFTTALVKAFSPVKTYIDNISDKPMLLVTTLAAIYTARAAIATSNSTKVSEATLLHTQRTSRRDEFISRYNLLLEQHKEQLNIVKSYLDTEKGKELLDGLIKGTDHLTAFKTLQGHNIISPYMRVLYHLLRHIDAHYIDNATEEDKKKYSSIVRSLIRNDVLFLVAVNASYVIEDNKENDYGKYQVLLRKFDFFEHAHFFIEEDVPPGFDKYAVSRVRKNVLDAMINNHEETMLFDKRNFKPRSESFRIPFIVSCVFDNPLNSESLECLKTIAVDFEKQAGEARDEYLTSNERNLNPREFVHDFYGRKYLKSTDDAAIEIDRTLKVDLDLYNQLPAVDEKYVNDYLSILKDKDISALTGDCYIRIFNADNNVSFKGQSDFWEPCAQFVSWEKHLKWVASGDADREYIQREKQRLSDFQSAVLRQRLIA